MSKALTKDVTGGEDNTLAQHTNATNGAAPSRKRKIQQTSEARAAPLLVTADDTASKRARGAKKPDWPRSKGPCVVCGEVTKERCFKHTSCDATRSPSTVWVLVKTTDKEGYTPEWEVSCFAYALLFGNALVVGWLWARCCVVSAPGGAFMVLGSLFCVFFLRRQILSCVFL